MFYKFQDGLHTPVSTLQETDDTPTAIGRRRIAQKP